jgi:AcrR family transcriptional regulator
VPPAADAALLDAARRTFAEHGYAGATLERIADAAGRSRVTLHRHGVTKDGLVDALLALATDDYRRRLWPALTATGTGAERLGAALHALCDTAEAHLPLLLALRGRTDDVFHDDGKEPLTRSVFTEPLVKLLREGAADRSLRAEDPAELATVLFNMVGWTYVHLRSGHGWPAARARRATLGPVLRGLAV